MSPVGEDSVECIDYDINAQERLLNSFTHLPPVSLDHFKTFSKKKSVCEKNKFIYMHLQISYHLIIFYIIYPPVKYS